MTWLFDYRNKSDKSLFWILFFPIKTKATSLFWKICCRKQTFSLVKVIVYFDFFIWRTFFSCFVKFFSLSLYLKVVVGSYNGHLKIYNKNLELVKSIQTHTDRIWRIKQSPFNNAKYIATCSSDKTIKTWDLNWNLIRLINGKSYYMCSLEFINENTIATGSEDKTIKIWTIKTGSIQRVINLSSSVYSWKLF